MEDIYIYIHICGYLFIYELCVHIICIFICIYVLICILLYVLFFLICVYKHIDNKGSYNRITMAAG